MDVGGRVRRFAVSRQGDRYLVTIGDRTWDVDPVRIDEHTLSLLITGRSHEVTLAIGRARDLILFVDQTPIAVSLNTQRHGRGDEMTHGAGSQQLTAPMPGKVVRVLVQIGDRVRARQPVVVVEAMKMENELRAARDGTVVALPVAEGWSVEAGTLVAVIEGDDA